MDGLRGIAMLFVFFGHFASMWSLLPHPGGLAEIYLRVIDADATIGSSFFMLLSGLFAYGTLSRGKPFGLFIRGRCYRLYPLYLLLCAAYVAGEMLYPKHSKLPSDPLQCGIFLLETLFFLPGVLPVHPLMDVAWTLSFVVLFYFISGLVAGLFRIWPVMRPFRILILIACGVVWAIFGQQTNRFEPRTAMFWVGMALSEVIHGIMGRRLIWAARLTVPAVALFVAGVWIRTELMLQRPHTPIPLALIRVGVTAVALFGVVWVAYFGPEWWKRVLSRPSLCELGAVSYSYYLTHGIAIKAFQHGMVPLLGPLAFTPVVFWSSQLLILSLSILIARAVYLTIENPLSTRVPKWTQAIVIRFSSVATWWNEDSEAASIR